MEDDVDVCGERADVEANRFAHSALDVVAVDSLAHDAAGGETNAGAMQRSARVEWPQREEVTHRSGELFAALLIDALIIGVFAQPYVARPAANRVGSIRIVDPVRQRGHVSIRASALPIFPHPDGRRDPCDLRTASVELQPGRTEHSGELREKVRIAEVLRVPGKCVTKEERCARDAASSFRCVAVEMNRCDWYEGEGD